MAEVATIDTVGILDCACKLQSYALWLHGIILVSDEAAMMEDDDYDDDDDGERESVLCKQVSLYAMLELAWHLCQAIFLESLPAGCLIQQLTEWVTWNCSEYWESVR